MLRSIVGISGIVHCGQMLALEQWRVDCCLYVWTNKNWTHCTEYSVLHLPAQELLSRNGWCAFTSASLTTMHVTCTREKTKKQHNTNKPKLNSQVLTFTRPLNKSNARPVVLIQLKKRQAWCLHVFLRAVVPGHPVIALWIWKTYGPHVDLMWSTWSVFVV